ncbi:MAG: IS21 family transposase [Thermaerobacter sp.]|nr:IS21 family transposase [Thermaerobacter sp.]
MPDIQSIRTLHQRGYSERQIAKLLKLNRATVHRYIEMAVVPTQVRMEIQEPRPAVKFKDEWKKTVRDLLQAEAEKQVRRKQRLTARKVHEVLVAKHSADISEVTVRRYVAEIRAERAKKAFVPLEFAPGEMAEVDFGHAEIIIGGVRKLWPFFAIRLMASGVRFVMVFPDEKLESLLAGIVHGLSFIGGVPHRLMFDNPSTIVLLRGGQRLQSPEFKALCAHYGFEADFANPRSGNEKGAVESEVGWAQRNPFSGVREAASLQELNAQLAAECLQDAQRTRRGDSLSVQELWDLELGHLGTLPHEPFPACRNRFVRVDKTLLCTYDGARYSVPVEHVRRAMLLRAFWDHIEILDQNGTTVAVHDRLPSGGSSLSLLHYLPVLKHKPRAVRDAAVISRGEPAIAQYRDAFLAARPDAYRELVAILQLSQQSGVAKLAQALATAGLCHAYDIESVRALLQMEEDVTRPLPLSASNLQRYPETPVPQVASAVYEALLEAAASREGD